ncbi:phage tail protein [Klebsiella aerogenes]|uniref:phage tail protein n=1 Tax=Klebsiella aerogenes TaxID=548 RepID=UPI003A92880E
MSEKYYSILTNRGKALEAESAASGKPVILKDFVIGDGNGQAVTPDPVNTTLVHEVYRGAISSLAVSPEQDNQFIAQLVLPADIGGFTVREVGLLTDSGELYAVGNCAAIEKPESGVSVRLQFRLAVNETADIELKVATGDGLFLRQDANLSDVKDKAESRKNIGLGTAATKDTGTSGATIPLLSTANTWSEVQTFKKDINVGTGGTTAIINLGDSQVIRDNGKKALVITSSSGALTGIGTGIFLRPKGTTDSAMEFHGDASGWSVDTLGVNKFSVNGSTTLKGGLNVGGAITNDSKDYVTKNGVGDIDNNTRTTYGYKVSGVNNTFGSFSFIERINQYSLVSFHVVGAASDAWFEFRDYGDMSISGKLNANGGAKFGGNLVVSWGGRTATYQENGDINGQLWSGTLSSYLSNMRNKANKASNGWFKDSVTGVIIQWGSFNASRGSWIGFPISFPALCAAITMTDIGNDGVAGGASGRTTSGFILRSSQPNLAATYIAIGY